MIRFSFLNNMALSKTAVAVLLIAKAVTVSCLAASASGHRDRPTAFRATYDIGDGSPGIALPPLGYRGSDADASPQPGEPDPAVVFARYGLEVRNSGGQDFKTVGTKPRRVDVGVARQILSEELQRYPTGMVRRIRLHRLILCGSLMDGDIPAGGVSIVQNREMFIDSSPMNRSFLRFTFDHEMGHFIDNAEGHLVETDRPWCLLNPPGFHYRTGSMYRIAAETPRGLVTPYATTAAPEDKAETFACLMADSARMIQMTQADSIIAAKVREVERRADTFDPELGRVLRSSAAPPIPGSDARATTVERATTVIGTARTEQPGWMDETVTFFRMTWKRFRCAVNAEACAPSPTSRQDQLRQTAPAFSDFLGSAAGAADAFAAALRKEASAAATGCDHLSLQTEHEARSSIQAIEDVFAAFRMRLKEWADVKPDGASGGERGDKSDVSEGTVPMPSEISFPEALAKLWHTLAEGTQIGGERG